MGEARRRRTLLDQLRAEQRYCIYCNDETLGDSVDHMPPRTIFDLRHRPKGLEFLACTACNAGGKKAEQIAGFLSRLLYPAPRTHEVDQELRKIFKQMSNNHRDVLLEMFPTDEQLANFKRSYPTLQQFKPLSVKGPLVNAAMRTFAAKMGLALHYRENHRVVPSAGAVIVRWFSNVQAFTNRIPPEILQMVGSPDTLRQGKFEVKDQFMYASQSLPEGNMSAHYATFRLSFAINAFVVEDAAMIEEYTPGPNVLHPGFLKSETTEINRIIT
jgi:hypothetical protein